MWLQKDTFTSVKYTRLVFVTLTSKPGFLLCSDLETHPGERENVHVSKATVELIQLKCAQIGPLLLTNWSVMVPSPTGMFKGPQLLQRQRICVIPY